MTALNYIHSLSCTAQSLHVLDSHLDSGSASLIIELLSCHAVPCCVNCHCHVQWGCVPFLAVGYGKSHGWFAVIAMLAPTMHGILLALIARGVV